MRDLTIDQPVILASQSPRRRELLTAAGITVEVVPSSVNEDAIQISDPNWQYRKNELDLTTG